MKKALMLIFLMVGTSNAALYDVAIVNFTFSPAELSIQPGDTVRWTNQDSAPHTATSNSDVWDSGNMNNGAVYSYVFSAEGSYPYLCLYHSNMTGVIIVGNPGGGDSDWIEIPTPTVLPLNDVYFLDELTGWAGGDQGILRTINGGDTWSLYATGDDVEAVYFIDSMEGWASGNDGMIIHSTDGGVSWSFQPSGVGEKIRDIRMADNMNGWAVGRDGILRHTSDGGASWNHQANPAVDDLRGIAIFDPSTAWIVGSDGVILHTANSGASWNLQPSGTAQELEGVHFIDSQNGWACGDFGVIVKTVNGGASWQILNSGTNAILNDIFFVTAEIGWVVGAAGAILFTNDGGVTWEQVQTDIFATLNAVQFLNADLGFAAGSDGSVYQYSLQTGIGDDLESALPGEFALKGNYPNPFNASTTIRFELERETKVSLEIYDITGRLVDILYNGIALPGSNSVTWHAAEQSSGVYFYRLRTDSGIETRRMTLLK
ncbi:MAG: YCF48-related protein [candidate division Zixibacteria bacterium]